MAAFLRRYLSLRRRGRWLGLRAGGLGVVALGINRFTATLQPDAHFGRILAVYGASSSQVTALECRLSLLPAGLWDIAGSAICLLGFGIIKFAPRNVG
jgi:small multidrug resistance family-3 protein